MIVETRGPQQIHAIIVPTLDQQFGVQETGVHNMGVGQKAPLLQRSVGLRGRCAIGRRADGRLDVGDQVRQVIVAGLREMHFVAHPLGGVLAGIVGFDRP